MQGVDEMNKQALSQSDQGQVDATVEQRLEVGQYTIRPMTSYDGKPAFWIEHESGEGMQCSYDSLEACITQFYAENF